MQDADVGRMTQCLVNNAVALRQTKQRSELLFGSISVHIEMQSNLLEANRDVSGNAERTTKIKIALRSNRGAAQWNVQSGCDCTQRDARASYERFQQHVRR